MKMKWYCHKLIIVTFTPSRASTWQVFPWPYFMIAIFSAVSSPDSHMLKDCVAICCQVQ